MTLLNLTYVPDFEHLFRASADLSRHIYPKSYRVRVKLITYGSMLVGGVLAAAAGISFQHFVLPQMDAFPLILCFLLLLFAFYAKVVIPWLTRGASTYLNGTRDRLPMHFTADEAGIRWQDDDIDFFVRWNGIEGVYATPQSLSFHSGVIALVLPLEAFPDATARKAFLGEVLGRITPEAATKSRADKRLVDLL